MANSTSRSHEWIYGLFLFVAVIFVYQPAWHGEFIWDDDAYVTNNPLLAAPDGLWRIWFSMDSPSQYFPLTYTVFRLEHALWGLNPAGYHWVNILLHATNALLVWRLLKCLAVSGAWLAAAIFALHPVNVEAVAWITELKSVLSLFFILLALLAWVEFLKERPKRLWRWYALAVIFYALALFAKTTACTLPAALLLILWLEKRPINGLRLAQIVPFLAMGMGMGLISIWWERYHVGTQGQMFSLGLAGRILVASHAIWFYLGKLVWPVNLTFSYPKWTIHPADALAWGWLAACAGLGAAIYFARRFVGRGLEVGVVFFLAMLSPLLGFIMLYTFRYTYVADHYQYVAVIGPMTLAAAGIAILLKRANPLLKPLFCGTLLLTLGVLTWRQCGIYANMETLWRTTIARNPGSWMACNNLGNTLLRKGRTDEAIFYIQRSLALQPGNAEGHYNLGLAFAQAGRLNEAIAQYEEALEISPRLAEVNNDLGLALSDAGRVDEAIVSYQRELQLNPDHAEAHFNLANTLIRVGRMGEAITNYERAVEIAPQYQQAQNNLAAVLATCPVASFRNGPRAIRLAESANQLAGGANPIMLGTLASAYAEAGRFSEAIATGQRALQLAAAQSDTNLMATLKMQLGCYLKDAPFRDNSLTNATPRQGNP